MKKSKLYQLVKDSLKEVLQEQNIRRPKRTPKGGARPKRALVGQPGIEAIEAEKNKEGDVVFTGGNQQNLGSFSIWEINISTGACVEKTVDGIWVCSVPGYYSDDEDDDQAFAQAGNLGVGGIAWDNEDINCFSQEDLNNPWEQFQEWVSGQTEFDGPDGNLSNDAFAGILSPNTGIGGVYISETCPACYPPELEGITGTTLPTPIAGNNLNLNSATLGFINDGSCVFEGCANNAFIDSINNPTSNHFCLIHPGICTGNNTPDLNYFAELQDDGSCTFDGCIDVSSHPSYVCQLMPAICNNAQNPALGIGINNNFTQNNTVCEVIPGCTNPLFSENLGGNYNPNANVDDGTCAVTFCPDDTFENWICNIPGFCDTSNEYLTEYVHFGNNNTFGFGFGVTNANGVAFSSPIAVGTNYIEDTGICAQGGCTDGGNLDQAFWEENGYDTITGVTDYPNFQAGNYNPNATFDDGTCNYFINGYVDNDGNPVPDFAAVLGCTDDGEGTNDLDGDGLPALNFDPALGANVDDGTCVTPIPGCVDNGDVSNYTYDPNSNSGMYNTPADNQAWWTGDNDSGTDYSALTGISEYPGVQSTEFNPNANVDDGSCDYTEGCTDPLANNTDQNAIIDDGSCIYDYSLGCLEPSANNYDASLLQAPAPADNGDCVFSGCTLNVATIFNTQGSPGGQTVIDANYVGENGVSLGDTTYWSQFLDTTTGLPLYPNGSPYLNLILQPGNGHNQLEGACDFEGCLDPNYNDYICNDPTYGEVICDNGQLGNSNNGISPNDFSQPAGACTDLQIEGCMDNTAGGEDPLNPTAYLSNPDVEGNMTCGSGGTEPCLATNYNPNANIAGDCNYNFCPDSDAYNFSSVDPLGNNWSNGSNGVTDLCQYEGCKDSSAPNGGLSQLHPSSTWNNPIYFYNAGNDGCQTSGGSNIDGMYFTSDLSPTNNNCCGFGGCTDNGNQSQQWWDAYGYSQPGAILSGVTVSNYPGVQALNYSANVNVDDGSCEYTLGCTDSAAPNYDSSAIIDDGSCLPPCKTVTLTQCNPEPMAPYTKTVQCAHIMGVLTAGQPTTPSVGNVVLANGVSADYGQPQDTPLEVACPNYCVSGGQMGDPFGGPGEVADDLDPGNGTVETTQGQGGTWGCTYVWTTGCWSLVNPGDTGYAEEPIKQAQGYTTQTAVFTVTNISPSTGPNVNQLAQWSNCGQAPPADPVRPDLDQVGPVKAPVRKDITEVEISKKLREALKNMYK